MPSTNMDTKKNPEATEPVFEFTLPNNELDASLAVGDCGEVAIPVEVVAVGKEGITLRKYGKAKTTEDFKEMSSSQIREKIGTVGDEYEPNLKKQEKE